MAGFTLGPSTRTASPFGAVRRAPGITRPGMTPRPQMPPQTPLQQAQAAQVQQQTRTLKPTVLPPGGQNIPITQSAYEQQAQTKLQSDLERGRGEQQHGQNLALEGLRAQQAQEALKLQLGHESAAQTELLGGRLKELQTGGDYDLRKIGAQGDVGMSQLNRQGELAGEQDIRRAGLSNEAFKNRWEMLNALPSVDGSAPVTGGGGKGIDPTEASARAAAFARAKDRFGQTARSSIDSLRGILSETGNLGGGAEAAGLASIIGGAQGGLGEFEREQLLADFNRAGQVADRNYTGNLSRRGQDLGYRQSLIGLLGSGIPALY